MSPQPAALSPGRFRVVAGLFVLSLITYVDRAAISSVKEPMAAELALDNAAVGLVFSVFALGYALGQVPSGWLADRLGPRSMLAGIVALWSILTALTGAVGGLASMIVVRFLFGIAEAGAFPGMARAFYNWLPPEERGRANGIVFSGSRIGAALAFPLMAWLLGRGDWRECFFWLAIPGLIWAALWAIAFRNHPPVKLTDSGALRGEGLPLGEALRTSAMHRAMVQYFNANFTTFLCLSWMNPYLKERYSLSTGDAAFYTMIPLLIGAGAQWATGAIVDHLFSTGRAAVSRQIPASVGFSISAIGALSIPFAPSAPIAAACFALAAFGAEMTISPSWAFCLDLGGKHSGAVSGAMNMAGNFGSFVSGLAFPWLAQTTGTSATYFWLVCVLNIIGVWCWRGMRRELAGVKA
jgi:MFS transporter, ACS family, glucarate transporter